jgi:hypothetical protein
LKHTSPISFDSVFSPFIVGALSTIVSCNALLDLSVAFSALASSAFALVARVPRFRGEAILRGLCWLPDLLTAGETERFVRGISGAGSSLSLAGTSNLGGVAMLLVSLSFGPTSMGEGSRRARIHGRMAYSSARARAGTR